MFYNNHQQFELLLKKFSFIKSIIFSRQDLDDISIGFDLFHQSFSPG